MKKQIIRLLAFILLFLSVSIAEESFDGFQKTEISAYYGYLPLLIDTHLEIGRGNLSPDSIFSSVGTLSKLKYYSDLDVVKYLSYTIDVSKGFDSLLQNIWVVLLQGESLTHQLKSNLDFFKIQKEDCDNQKTINDKNFFLSLQDLDGVSMENYFNKSLELENCSTKARISYNAQKSIVDELDFYTKILEHKYRYFYDNKFDIIENYPNILYNLKK